MNGCIPQFCKRIELLGQGSFVMSFVVVGEFEVYHACTVENRVVGVA
jgi:hypothetical protein